MSSLIAIIGQENEKGEVMNNLDATELMFSVSTIMAEPDLVILKIYPEDEAPTPTYVEHKINKEESIIMSQGTYLIIVGAINVKKKTGLLLKLYSNSIDMELMLECFPGYTFTVVEKLSVYPSN